MATWLESGREKRNLGMAGLSAVLQVPKQPETFKIFSGPGREGARVGARGFQPEGGVVWSQP